MKPKRIAIFLKAKIKLFAGSLVIFVVCHATFAQTDTNAPVFPAATEVSRVGGGDVLLLQHWNGTATTNQAVTLSDLFTAPTFSSGTSSGPFYINPSSPAKNDAQLNFGRGAQIAYDYHHSVETELGFVSQGSASFTLGLDSRGLATCHLGGSGQYNSLFFMQYNDEGDLSEPGQSTPFGFAYHNNNGAAQTFHFAGFYLRSTDTNAANELQWHDHFGKPPTKGGAAHGFHQPEWESFDHIAGSFRSNEIIWGGAVLTNAIARGNVTTTPEEISYIDFALTAPDFVTLTPHGALTLEVKNLAYTNLSFEKRIVLSAGHNAVPLKVPSDWITVSPLGNATAPTKIPGSHDLVIRLNVNCGLTTNIYAEYLSGFNPQGAGGAAQAN